MFTEKTSRVPIYIVSAVFARVSCLDVLRRRRQKKNRKDNRNRVTGQQYIMRYTHYRYVYYNMLVVTGVGVKNCYRDCNML